jgi:hypothetical protein
MAILIKDLVDQTEQAKKLGTTQSVISRLEDPSK